MMRKQTLKLQHCTVLSVTLKEFQVFLLQAQFGGPHLPEAHLPEECRPPWSQRAARVLGA